MSAIFLVGFACPRLYRFPWGKGKGRSEYTCRLPMPITTLQTGARRVERKEKKE
jgi:hypothetical protein